MSLNSSEKHSCSWRISTVLIYFLLSPSSCHAFLPLAIRPMSATQEIFLKNSLILQNWTAPSCSRCTCGPWRRRINFFDISKTESEYFPGSTSVQILFSIGTVLGGEPAGSLLRGFALVFDRHAKSFASSFDASWYSGISCSLLFKFITNMFDPWEFLTKEWELSLFKDIILISTPYLPCKQQVATSNMGPILLFPWIHPFGCDDLHLLEECIRDMPLHKILKNLRCLSSWSIVQFQQHSGILHPYKNYLICLVVTAFQFVLHIVAIEDLC